MADHSPYMPFRPIKMKISCKRGYYRKIATLQEVLAAVLLDLMKKASFPEPFGNDAQSHPDAN